MTPRQIQFMEEIRNMCAANEVYTHDVLAKRIKCSTCLASDLMMEMIRRKIISVMRVRRKSRYVCEVTICATGEHTRPIDGAGPLFVNEKMNPDDEAANIIARRDAAERERTERRKYWLEQEKMPRERRRSMDDDFRLTASEIAALSGGTMRSLRG